VRMKKIYLLILSLFPILLLRAGSFRLLFLDNFRPEPLFMPALLNHPFTFPYWATSIFGLLNIFLIWLIAKKLFGEKVAFWVYFIYGTSPWPVYLEYGATTSVFILWLLLLGVLGILFVRQGRKTLGNTITLFSLVCLLCSSFLMWITLPPIIWTLHRKNLFPLIKSKLHLGLGVIFLIPALILFVTKFDGVKNIARNQITLFSDVGLINNVNAFQGENHSIRPQILARLTENRYTYFGLHFIYSALNTLNSINYFAPQTKIFGFSQSPALWAGFLIPFFFGLTKILSTQKGLKTWLPISLMLFIPALLSRDTPDFSKTIIVAPIFCLLIVFGLRKLFASKKKYLKTLGYLVVALIVIQFLVVLADIFIREPWRLYELTKI